MSGSTAPHCCFGHTRRSTCNRAARAAPPAVAWDYFDARFLVCFLRGGSQPAGARRRPERRRPGELPCSGQRLGGPLHHGLRGRRAQPGRHAAPRGPRSGRVCAGALRWHRPRGFAFAGARRAAPPRTSFRRPRRPVLRGRGVARLTPSLLRRRCPVHARLRRSCRRGRVVAGRPCPLPQAHRPGGARPSLSR